MCGILQSYIFPQLVIALSWIGFFFYSSGINIFSTHFPFIFPFQWGNAVQQRRVASRCVCHVKMAVLAETLWLTYMSMEMSCPGQGVDTVLSETGIQQCEAVGRYLRDTKFCNVFVSDLQRTVQVREPDVWFPYCPHC